MGLTPISFTGISNFSDDFQAVLERSFEVASLPIAQLQTDQLRLTAQREELGTLQSALISLRSSITALAGVAQDEGASASSTDTAVATLSVSGNPGNAQFDLNVSAIAEAAQETTSNGLADTDTTALEADGIYKLTLATDTTTFDLLTIGSGRTAGTSGSATPDPKVSVDVTFSNGLSGSISAELESFFVAAAAPSGAGAGDTVSVTFQSTDSSINETITTAALGAGATATDIANALNTAITGNANLTGKVSFSDEGGNLKLQVADTAGTGFTFTSSATGTVVSGLESGGTVGGHSAEEIASALNAQVALNSSLLAAGVTFSAESGEVRVSGNQAFDITTTDNAQGTGFASGLAGAQSFLGYANTLAGIRDYVNANTETLGVRATIINTSSDISNPDYHLTLTADDTGATTLTLQDSADNQLLTSVNQGADASFTVNGLNITNSSNSIPSFVPGGTLTLQGPGTATVGVSTDTAGLADSLGQIATSYNAVVSEITRQVGEDAGLLSGNVLIRQAQQVLREFTGFIGTGDVQSVAALGLELSESGLLSFNSTAFGALTDDQLAEGFAFIGSTTTGLAGDAITRLTDLADPVTGQIQTTVEFLLESEDAVEDQIAAQQERVDRLIANLEVQFQAADLLLSEFEAQQTLLTQLFNPDNGDN